MKTYEDILQRLIENNGVMTIGMGVLRDAHGAGKLGVNVVANIKAELNRRGIGHIPDPLPINQHEVTRIYQLGSPVGRFLEAAQTPGESNDEALRELVDNEAVDKIRRIKDMLGGD